MAIKFLTGLDIDGNIDLNQNELVKPRIENLAADPAGVEGQIYYNTGTDKLKYYAASGWVTLTTGADADTTYALSGVGSANGTAGVRLTDSDGNNDDVLIVGGGTTSVTRVSNTITVTSIEVYQGTVTTVSSTTAGNALDVAVSNPTSTPA